VPLPVGWQPSCLLSFEFEAYQCKQPGANGELETMATTTTSKKARGWWPRTTTNHPRSRTQRPRRTQSSRLATTLPTRRETRLTVINMRKRLTGWPRCWPLRCRAPKQQARVPWRRRQGFGAHCKPR
jgi:hypothetical protein